MGTLDDLLRQIRAIQDPYHQLKGLGMPFELARGMVLHDRLMSPMPKFGVLDTLAGLGLASSVFAKLQSDQRAMLGFANTMESLMPVYSQFDNPVADLVASQSRIFGSLSALDALRGPSPFQLFGALGDVYRWSADFALRGLDESSSQEGVLEIVEVSEEVALVLEAVYDGSDQGQLGTAIEECRAGILAARHGLLKKVRTSGAVSFVHSATGGAEVMFEYERIQSSGTAATTPTLREVMAHNENQEVLAPRLLALAETLHVAALRSEPSQEAGYHQQLDRGVQVVVLGSDNGWLLVCALSSTTGKFVFGYLSEREVVFQRS
jgi:hypothetical protein